LGQFVVEHVEKKKSELFGGTERPIALNHRELALDIFPFIRAEFRDRGD